MRRQQHLRPARGAKQDRTRKGCGIGSGKGGTSGRGHKGQKARTNIRPGFEGGQLPLQRRLTHKGFSNARFSVRYQTVNIGLLNRFEKDSVVTPDTLREAGLISSRQRPVKILGDGRLEHGLTVCAHAFTRSAESAIREAGGVAEVLS